MAYRSPYFQPKQDTGWGLIYRLNLLLGKIEQDIEQGDLERWNLHIDRVYVNIVFKNEEKITKDKNGKITGVDFSKEDVMVFSRFNEMLEENKRKLMDLKNIEDDEERIKEKRKLLQDKYNTILKKDIWMRKKMFKLNLYLREVEHDPRKAIYGG